MTHLLAAIQNVHLSEECRLMAAVVLRRLFTSEFFDFYSKVGVEIVFILFYFIFNLISNVFAINHLYDGQQKINKVKKVDYYESKCHFDDRTNFIKPL